MSETGLDEVSPHSTEKRRAYIIHGCFDEERHRNPDERCLSHSDWLPWLQKQLILKGYLCQTPEMPSPYRPNYNEWAVIADGFILNDKSLIVAHSCGAGFALRWLAENLAILNI